jgi:hypothetical protein
LRGLSGVTVYNCTEGGAYIPGMDHRRLADVIPLLDREIDVAGELDAAAMTIDAARVTRIVDHVAAFLRGLRRCRRYATVAGKLIRRGDTGRRLVGIERGLAATLKPLTFASLLAQRELDRAHDVARRPGAETDYLAASASLFDTLVDVVDRLEPVLHQALEHIGVRRTRGRAA